MTDDARRDRVIEAIGPAMILAKNRDNYGMFFDIETIADAAIAAYENEPEPTPQLLEDIAVAIDNTDLNTPETVVRRAYEYGSRGYDGIARCLGIPESMVKELLDE